MLKSNTIQRKTKTKKAVKSPVGIEELKKPNVFVVRNS